jgi:hypothetical protein
MDPSRAAVPTLTPAVTDPACSAVALALRIKFSFHHFFIAFPTHYLRNEAF